MFLTLLGKECKMQVRSVMYWVYVTILCLFYVTQMGDISVLEKPVPGQDSYGTMASTNETDIMNGTLRLIAEDCTMDHYVTYPFGFYKEVSISESEKHTIENCICELTGLTKDEWQSKVNEYYGGLEQEVTERGQYSEKENVPWSLFVDSNLSYEEFLRIMEKVSDILGKGSAYSKEQVKYNGEVEVNYEQALTEYEDILYKDKVTGAFARLFSDYMGILLGILPVFFVVARVLRDKKNKVSDVLYSKKVSSATMVLSRFIGTVVMIFIPVVVVSCLSLSQAVYVSYVSEIVPDYFAYIKYCISWLLPEIIFICGLGYCVSELFESTLAVLVQGVWWFLSIFASSNHLVGLVGWNLILRFNTVGSYMIYESIKEELLKNRIIYTLGGLLFAGVAIMIYDKKRKGGIRFVGKKYQNLECKSEV